MSQKLLSNQSGIYHRHRPTISMRRIIFTTSFIRKDRRHVSELVTRNDLKIFLPPIGGMTAYIFGDLTTIPQADKPLTVRVHDECNGSDVFGSDICTCRPYLTHGIELCIEAAQAKGAGIIVTIAKRVEL